LTGAPGSGKTVILGELRAARHAVVDEAATDVIAAWHAAGADGEPWRDTGWVRDPSAARWIGYAEALEFGALHERVCRAHGYQPVDVPPGPVSERAALVDRLIRSWVFD